MPEIKSARAATASEESFAIGSGVIGGGARCFIIAEAGVNHNGDEALAHQLIDEAARSGADAVKFQTFDPALLVSDAAPQADYQSRNTGAVRTQKEMLGSLTLPLEAYKRLTARAKEKGIIFLSTPFDERSADFLAEIDCPAFKLSSGEVTNHSLLAHVARKGRPVLLSTGMSTLDEVESAVAVIRANGSPPLALLHCVTNYPASPSECNLRAMETMRSAFHVPIGWSDHTIGDAVTIAAVAMGAELLEKHFTLSRELPGPDHKSSLEPDELGRLVQSVRDVEAAFGSGVKAPAESEIANAKVVRRSLHATRKLEPGHVIEAVDLISLRPAGGLPPGALASTIGRTVRRGAQEGEMLTEEHFN